MAEKKASDITLKQIEKEMEKGLTQKQAIANIAMGKTETTKKGKK